ncbi:hypothetical protein PQU96_09770 [Vogesella sp. LYT5W]|uniref:Uncharacterized protein n=1 Tax=Vogesella margarita TaxID=2984199 RepID=A0ABT5IPD3_9NEIS|nr:hypothetical protein [Vogesella margarita]MDC7714414.1 hypothetical protein [Vogesella margarita]
MKATIFPLFWEPVAGTGERLTAAAIISMNGESTGHILIRDDVLNAMYGEAAGKLKTLFSAAIETYLQLIPLAAVELPPLMGLAPGRTIETDVMDRNEALRISALMYSSLANLDALDSDSEDLSSNQAEGNKRFATQVREQVVARYPELDTYFNRTAILLNGGEPVRFGFSSPKAILHFGMLHPVRQPSSVRDARAKLWELARAKDISGVTLAGLIMAVPPDTDPTLGDKQRTALKRNLDEIEREADSVSMRLWPASSTATAADKLCELVI